MTIRTRSGCRLLTVAFALLGAACGGSDDDGSTGPNGTPTGSANFTATIDGASWAGLTIATSANGTAGGIFTIIGANAAGTGLGLTLYNIRSTGTYPFGVGPTITGGTATVSAGSGAWATPLNGASGTVTISAVSATRIAGTFSFVAEPLFGTAASKTVTSGAFDLPVTVTGGSIAVPDQNGGNFVGTIAGAPWNAATVVMVSKPSSGIVTIGASNTAYNLNVIISGYTAPGTYTMNTGVSRQATLIQVTTGVAKSWGGTGTLSSGTFTITTATATRLAGSYNLTLHPNNTAAGTAAIIVTGTFDVGIPQ